MFATQHYMEAMSDAPKKRGRDDEVEADAFALSFSEHRNKRVQCLPLRTSPRVSQQTGPASSSDASYSDPNGQANDSHFSAWPSSVAAASHQDAEMDMMDTLSPPPQHGQFTPQVEGYNVANRMPTPIQPSFAAQVRGQHGEWAGPGPAVGSLSGTVNLGHQQTGFPEEQAVPRTMAEDADWRDVQTNRRLPSPISEADDLLVCPHSVDESGALLDNSHVHSQLSMRLQNSSLSSNPSPPHAMDHPNAMMDVESHGDPQSLDPNGDPATPSPNRRGHVRSKHTVNSWTWQPGMKKSFSIGYRSDCEKCRLKVPGHFNHIIIS